MYDMSDPINPPLAMDVCRLCLDPVVDAVVANPKSMGFSSGSRFINSC